MHRIPYVPESARFLRVASVVASPRDAAYKHVLPF